MTIPHTPTRPKTKTLFIGWDSADWQLIRPLLEQGWMPNLQALMDRGVHGNLSTLVPTLSPMLWNTIATGKQACDHGILGFMEVNAEGTDVQPASSTSRKTRALWNILSGVGYRTNVVSWFASHPAEPVNGACVSDQFPLTHLEGDRLKPAPDGSVYPETWRGPLDEMRVSPLEITADDLAPFLCPEAPVDNEEDQDLLLQLRRQLAELSSTHSAVTHLMQEEPWDFTGVYYQPLDIIKHHFMELHPPKMPHVDERQHRVFGDVITNLYRFHDLMLGRLLELAGEDTLVLLCSDHGFLNNHLRPENSSATDPKQAAQWHRQYGMMVMAGPGIAQGQEIYGAGLLDILPTLLCALGLPIGEDMPGKILPQVFSTPPEVLTIPSWDQVEGNFGEHAPDQQFSSLDAGEAMKHLVELGYLAKAPEDRQERVDTIRRDMQKNLANSQLNCGRFVEAQQTAQALYTEVPDLSSVIKLLAACEEKLGNVDRAQELSQELIDRHDDAPYAQARLQRNRLSETPDEQLESVVDTIIHRENHTVTMLAQFTQILDARHAWVLARSVVNKVLEMDSENAWALETRAVFQLRENDFEAAVETALHVTSLEFERARPHYILGCALARLGQLPEAMAAFQQAIQRRPNWPQPHQALKEISEWMGADQLAGLQGAAAERAKKEQIRRIKAMKLLEENVISLPASDEQAQTAEAAVPDGPFVTVVSGLPRSGTSLMMQALDVGGIPPLTDGERAADEDNPRGYYELEGVKQIRQDDSFLDAAPGKAVKLIHALVTSLPARQPYRVIMMRRDLDEVLRSQSAMLERSDRSGAKLTDEALKASFQQQMDKACAWLDRQPNIQRLDVDYASLIADPEREMQRVAAFLGGELDAQAMAKTVDPSLYRNRGASV